MAISLLSGCIYFVYVFDPIAWSWCIFRDGIAKAPRLSYISVSVTGLLGLCHGFSASDVIEGVSLFWSLISLMSTSSVRLFDPSNAQGSVLEKTGSSASNTRDPLAVLSRGQIVLTVHPDLVKGFAKVVELLLSGNGRTIKDINIVG